MEFLYTANPDAERPIILLNTFIGVDENGEQGIDGAQFQTELLSLESRGIKECEIWINSIGGSVIDGYSIYGAIVNSRMKVITKNIGIAASTAGWIFQAGTEREMMDYSLLMMHNPHGGGEKGMKEFKDSIATMLASKCNKSFEEVSALMDKTTFMTADEAYSAGFCDKVKVNEKVKNEEMLATKVIDNKMFIANKWIASYVNQLKTPKMDLNKVTNLLGLVNEANVEAIADAITKLKNGYEEDCKNYEEELNRLKDELVKSQEDFERKKKVYDEMEEDFNALKSEKEASEQNAMEDKCNLLITDAVNKGQIANEEAEIAEWKNLLKLNFESVKNRLDKLPINIAAPKLVNDAKTQITTVPTTVEEHRKYLKSQNKL